MSPVSKFAATVMACGAVGLAFLGVGAASRAPEPAGEDIAIDLDAPPVGRFIPDQAFGAAVDGLVSGRVDKLFTPHNERAILTAGLRPVSYSLRTELAIEAWHWGEEGAWSDPRHRQGYWTSSVHPRRPVMSGWGYFLPRRGDTTDQANDTGYSRLDDGDRVSFWKSNPYLDPAYAKAEDRPQWVIVSFAGPTPVSAAKIDWAAPYARQFSFQYWVGDNVNDDGGRWLPFPAGAVTNGRGGRAVVTLSPAPIKVQYVRLLLNRSSHSALPGSTDRRDAMGFAIREIGLGVIGPDGRFADAVRHAPAGDDQTNVYVSSTDPWHRASDRDPDVEQPGFDRVFRSGLTRGLPVMVSVGPLYDTPRNAAAEIRFLKARGYPVREVEIGEEPDGQNVSAEDFSDLYLQFAAAVHAVDPNLRVGGPSLQDAVTDTWLDDNPDHAWTRRFVAALAARGRLADLAFFSFEHYPYDTLCGRLDGKLVKEDAILESDVTRLHAEGVPRNIPLVISEYGLSAFSGVGEVNLPGALFDADL
ncbi:MAG TPA: discoidin domain-containing protein, partial [Caulobacteraceae bacterium]